MKLYSNVSFYTYHIQTTSYIHICNQICVCISDYVLTANIIICTKKYILYVCIIMLLSNALPHKCSCLQVIMPNLHIHVKKKSIYCLNVCNFLYHASHFTSWFILYTVFMQSLPASKLLYSLRQRYNSQKVPWKPI